VLLCKDLIFMSKIKGTAAELGFRIMVASNNLLAMSMIETHKPRVVFIDLNAGAMVAPQALIAYQEVAGSETWFVAFGSHVDAHALAAAKDAGCHVVLPRSRFAGELPVLMQEYFCQPVARTR
jgi:AmiR/NasT family two-component response regulator